jgi:tetratricopeptide (TPR) repeat protein
VRDLPYDTSYTIDPHTLRDIPNNPDDILRAVAFLQREVMREDIELADKLPLYGECGSLARLIGELDIAQKMLEQAIQLATSLDNHKALVVNQIRLAHVHQWRRDFSKSDAMFAVLLENIDPLYADFIHQHAGKNAFDQGDYQTALDYFHLALEIRIKKGDPTLIESTQSAIHAANIRI